MKNARRNIPTELLRTFMPVVELDGVTRAANALGRSQPAARLQPKRLESFVGVPLCQWDGRRMAPTASGEMLPRCTRPAAAVRRLVEFVAERLDERHGDLPAAAVEPLKGCAGTGTITSVAGDGLRMRPPSSPANGVKRRLGRQATNAALRRGAAAAG